MQHLNVLYVRICSLWWQLNRFRCMVFYAHIFTSIAVIYKMEFHPSNAPYFNGNFVLVTSPLDSIDSRTK